MAHDRFLGGKSVDQEMILLSATAAVCCVVLCYNNNLVGIMSHSTKTVV